MDFLSNLSKLSDNHQEKPQPQHQQQQQGDKIGAAESIDNDFNKHRSGSDVIHSAKVVAEAAQAHLRHEPEKYDKAQLANATADLLDAAQEYGKLENEKGIGKYVEKAEEYLRNYNNASHPIAGAGAGAVSDAHGGEKVGVPAAGGGAHESGEKHSGGGGYGDYVKMAGDFLKK